jgi:chitin disaccharide deacetylase
MTETDLPAGLIINADDLAIHPRINAGILSAYRNGVLTSSTMLLTTPYLEETIREIVRPRLLPIGLHLSLTLGRPAAPMTDVSDLVDDQGYLMHSAASLMTRSFTDDRGRHLLAQIRKEFAAQLALARDWGVKPTHLDSHQHVHMNPAIFEVFQEEAQRFGMTRVRFVREPFPLFGFYLRLCETLARKNQAKWALIRLLRRGIRPRLQTTDNFFGVLYSGLMSKPVLQALISWASPHQSLEIGIHPGFPMQIEQLSRSELHDANFIRSPARQEEHDALLDDEIVNLIRRRGLQLRSFDGALKPGSL